MKAKANLGSDETEEQLGEVVLINRNEAYRDHDTAIEENEAFDQALNEAMAEVIGNHADEGLHYCIPFTRTASNSAIQLFILLEKITGSAEAPINDLQARIYFLSKLINWAHHISEAKLLEPLAPILPLETTARPQEQDPPYFSHIEAPFLYNRFRMFASPTVFANICSLRRTQLSQHVPSANLLSLAFTILTKSQARSLEDQWRIRLIDIVLYQQFLRTVDQLKKQMQSDKNQRKRARNHGENVEAPRTEQVKKRAYDQMLAEWVPNTTTESRLDLIKTRIKEGQKASKILIGDSCQNPFWMLAPVDGSWLDSVAHNPVGFIDELHEERPLLFKHYTELCKGLRVVLGLDPGSLKIDTMDPSDLAREELDSDMLLTCLDVIEQS